MSIRLVLLDRDEDPGGEPQSMGNGSPPESSVYW